MLTVRCTRSAARLVLLAIIVGTGILAAAEPRLVLTASATEVAVGGTVTVTVSVANAPPFSCFGATVVLPATGISTTDQAAGATPTWVADSRGILVPGARFGGYHGYDPASNHPAGTHVLGTVTVRASRPGTYLLRAPPYDADTAPFGGILLPAASTSRVIPAGAELTITVTGDAVARAITMALPPDHVWGALAPADADVGLPAGGVQVIAVDRWQDALLAPVPAVNQ